MEIKPTTRFSKKIIMFLAVFALAVGGTFTYIFNDFSTRLHNPENWQPYSEANARFDIQFPKDPEENSKQIHIADKKIEYLELSSEVERSVYAVSYIDFPGKWRMLGSNKLLTKSFDYLMEQENIDRMEKRELIDTNQGFPALDYAFYKEGKKVEGRLVLANTTLYHIVVSYPLEIAEHMQSSAFLASFQVKD